MSRTVEKLRRNIPKTDAKRWVAPPPTPPAAHIYQRPAPDPIIDVTSQTKITARQLANPNLSLAAGDLTSAEELRLILHLVEEIQTKRRALLRNPKSGLDHMPTIRVAGYGAEYSDKSPYRTPEAQALRRQLAGENVILMERPWDADHRAIARMIHEDLPKAGWIDLDTRPQA